MYPRLGKVGCAAQIRVAMDAWILRHCHKGAGERTHKRPPLGRKDVNMTDLWPAAASAQSAPGLLADVKRHSTAGDPCADSATTNGCVRG